jgi:hypothetical protein
MTAVVELELTPEARDGLIAVERMLEEIVDILRDHASKDELKYFTFAGWYEAFAEVVLKDCYVRSPHLTVAAAEIWNVLVRKYRPLLNLLNVAQAGVFVQGVDRLQRLEERHEKAFIDTE